MTKYAAKNLPGDEKSKHSGHKLAVPIDLWI